MHTTRVSLEDRRRYADQTTVRWRVMVGTAAIGLLAALVVRVWGNPLTRADETLILILTVLVVGLSPIVEWVFRFAFARVSTLGDRLAAADREIERLTAESMRLRAALQIESFAAEAEELEGLAAPFWGRLERAFTQYSVAPLPNQPRTLAEMVDVAPWPDRAPPWSEKVVPGQGGPTHVSELLAVFVRSIYPRYGFELIPREQFPDFDALRRTVRRRIRQWGERLKSDQRDEVLEWLRARVAPEHSDTIKLAWYLELANDDRTGTHEPGDDSCYRAVRDALESPGVRLTSGGARN